MSNDLISEKRAQTILFIGAHPDDIEIGAGGAVARLAAQAWDVWLCILTDEAKPTSAADRRAEAVAGAKELGISAERVLFTGLRDSEVVCNGDSVALLRQTVHAAGVDPDLVFTHTEADSHNDHRAAHDITRAAFRKKAILGFAVCNSLVASEFTPRLFIDVTAVHKQKLSALDEHKSQRNRIKESAINKLERSYASRLGCERAEGFEIIVQEGADDRMHLLSEINDCPFHRFWYTLIDSRKMMLVYAVPVWRKQKEWDWPTDKDREGVSLLHNAFKDYWYGRDPIEEYSCGTPNVDTFMDRSDVMLSGGAVSNTLTRSYFNYFRGIRYVIHYEMPDYSNISIFDRSTSKHVVAQYRTDTLGNRTPLRDTGILTVMRNPMASGRVLVGCMGIHGYGSLACYKVLSTPLHLAELVSGDRVPLQANGFQVLIEYDVVAEKAQILEKTYHLIEA